MAAHLPGTLPAASTPCKPARRYQAEVTLTIVLEIPAKSRAEAERRLGAMRIPDVWRAMTGTIIHGFRVTDGDQPLSPAPEGA